MRYTTGGFSWLSVAPESEEEKKVEQIEQKLHELKKEYEKTADVQLLSQIESLEKELREYEENRNSPNSN